LVDGGDDRLHVGIAGIVLAILTILGFLDARRTADVAPRTEVA
jgi:hypothetical protein